MEQPELNGCSIAYSETSVPAVRVLLSKDLRTELLAAQKSGTSLSLKVKQGAALNDVQATISIGSKVHTLVGHSVGQALEQVFYVDEAAGSGRVAARIQTSCLVQQKDIAAGKARVQAASQQAAKQKHKSQTLLLDVPISLPAVRDRSPSPLGRPVDSSAAGRSRNPPQQLGALLARQPGPNSTRAPYKHIEVDEHPAQQPGQQQQQQRVQGPSQSVGKLQDRDRSRSRQPNALHKRPMTAPSGNQLQQCKRQRSDPHAQRHISGVQPGGPGSATNSRAVALQKQQERQPGGQLPAPAFLGQGPRVQLKQDRPPVRPTSSSAAAGRQWQPQDRPLVARQSPSVGIAAGRHAVGEQRAGSVTGVKRAANELVVSSDRTPIRQHSAGGRPATTASPAGSQGKSAPVAQAARIRPNTADAAVCTSKLSKAPAIAESKAHRKAQLRSNKQYQDFGELEEGEILAGYDDGDGGERFHVDPPAQGLAKKQLGKKQGRSAGAGSGWKGDQAASGQRQRQKHQQQGKQTGGSAGKGSQLKQVGGKPPQQMAAAAEVRFAKKHAKLSQPVEPATSGVAGPKLAKAPKPAQPPESARQRQLQQQTKVGAGLSVNTKADVVNRPPATAGVSSSKLLAVQGQQQTPAADSNVSSRLVVRPPAGSLNSGQRPSRDRSVTPGSTPTSRNNAVDLGPPGYRAFVTRPPREFSPITSEQQYQQYQKQFQDQLAMYHSLQYVLSTSVERVKAARATAQLAPEGSEEQQLAAAAAEDLRRVLKPMTEDHMRAADTLNIEGEHLQAHINHWLAVRRPAGVGGAQQGMGY